jgi:hypothetical protein
MENLTELQKELFDYCLSRYDHEVDGGEPTTQQELDLIDFIQQFDDASIILDSEDDMCGDWWYDNQETLENILSL